MNCLSVFEQTSLIAVVLRLTNMQTKEGMEGLVWVSFLPDWMLWDWVGIRDIVADQPGSLGLHLWNLLYCGLSFITQSEEVKQEVAFTKNCPLELFAKFPWKFPVASHVELILITYGILIGGFIWWLYDNLTIHFSFNGQQLKWFVFNGVSARNVVINQLD